MLNFAAKESKTLMSANADIGKEIESAHVGKCRHRQRNWKCPCRHMPTSAVKGLRTVYIDWIIENASLQFTKFSLNTNLVARTRRTVKFQRRNTYFSLSVDIRLKTVRKCVPTSRNNTRSCLFSHNFLSTSFVSLPCSRSLFSVPCKRRPKCVT